MINENEFEEFLGIQTIEDETDKDENAKYSVYEATHYKGLIEIFKEIILKSYGEKSEDGKRFKKSEELSESFSQTEAYSEMFMEFFTDTESAISFINNIIPDIEIPEEK